MTALHELFFVMMKLMNERVFKAVITSDFHMSASPDPSDAIVSLMKLQRPVFDAFFDMLIREHTDLLILCGDNTQSGSVADMRMLEEYLNRLAEKDIDVIMCSGNHDFDSGYEEYYEQLFFPLLKPDEKDPHSLSYLRRIGSYTFFAMDDHEGKRSPRGVLKAETVEWLKRKLRKEAELRQKIIFLSHHNLHADAWMGRPEFYCLSPSDVKDLLVQNSVKLACSGHLHDPKIYHSKIDEIVTPMLLAGNHMYGEMMLGEQEIDYHLRRFYFSGPLLQQVYKKDRICRENRMAVYEKILKDSHGKYEISMMLERLGWWQDAMQSGTVYEHRDQLLQDQHFLKALDLLGDSAWGKWIRASLDASAVSSCSLRIEY